MKYLSRSIPFLLFFSFICYIIYSADTNNDFWLMKVAEKIKYGDKIGHLVLYGLLGMFLNIALKNRMIHTTKLPLGSVIVLIFAIAEEFTQLAFETRTFDYIDMLCDVIGLGFASLVAIIHTQKSVFYHQN